MSGRKATTNIIPGRIALSVGKPSKIIPDGWNWVLLLDVAKLATGHTPSRKVPEYWGGEIPWMAVGDARKRNGKKIYETKEYTNNLGIANSAAVLLPVNTVCLSRTASIGYVIMLGKPMATSQGFVNWICSEKLNPRFLQLLFLSENQFLYEISEGTAHTTIYYPEVKAFNIAMPPRPEQDHIVAKVDVLMAQVATMQKSLDRIPQLLKDFRQQVLTQAVTGKLTEEWREGKELGEWKVKHLQEVSETRLGKMLDRAKNTGQLVDYLRNINVRWFHIDFSDVEKLKIEKEDLHKFTLLQNDILVCEGGEPGRAALWKYDRENIIFQKALHRVRLFPEILPEYFLYHLKNDADNSVLRQYFTGTTIKHLTGRQFAKYEVNVPPIEEQKEIVKRVEALFAKADIIEKKYNALKTKIDKLPQAILHRAFKGELVEQLPTDGDAKDLLREIEGLKMVKGK